MINLKGKIAIITGASRGIGREIALAFAREKVNLSLWFEKSSSLAEETAKGGRLLGASAISLQADVRSEDAIQNAVKATMDNYGSIDILINNAGISLSNSLQKATEDEWDATLAVNLKGVFLCSKAVIASMIEKGGGHIINISSVAAIRGIRGGAAYAASKTGVIALTQTIAKEYGRKNIRANCILPGFHITGMTERLPEDAVKRTIASNVLGRTTTFDEVAAFAVFLAKTENISGQVFNLDSRIKKEI